MGEIQKAQLQAIPHHQAVDIGPPTPTIATIFSPHWDTFEVTEDLQGGTIREGWIVGGNPYQALKHRALGQGFTLGDPHQFFPDHFLVKRHFRYFAQAKKEDGRLTLMTVLWQKMPCPHQFAVDFGTVLVAQPSWWTYDNPPKNLTRSLAGESVVRPLIVMTLRMPIAEQDLKTMVGLAEQVGKRNNKEFARRPEGFWLFEDLRVRHLWGAVGQMHRKEDVQQPGTARFEIALTFKGDPWRAHGKWKAIWPKTLRPIPEPDSPPAPDDPFPEDIGGFLPQRPSSNSFEDMRLAHRVFNPYPIHTEEFLLDFDLNLDACVFDPLTDP